MKILRAFSRSTMVSSTGSEIFSGFWACSEKVNSKKSKKGGKRVRAILSISGYLVLANKLRPVFSAMV
jgi:hypothetical protein